MTKSDLDPAKGIACACLTSLIFCAAVVGVVLFVRVAFALDLNLSGFSYHTDRDAWMESFNPGAGLRQDFHDDARGTGFVEAGIYRDSLRAWAKYGGVGYQLKLGKTLRAGALLAVIRSRSYNDGQAFIAPVPMVSLDFGRVKLHSIFIPASISEKGGDVFGFYVGIPIF